MAYQHYRTVYKTHPSQVFAYLLGLAYLLLGAVGFFITGLAGDVTRHTGDMLLWFAINPANNLLHLCVGILGLIFAARLATARLYGSVLFLAFGAAFGWGLLAVYDSVSYNPLDLNRADNWLHAGTAAAGLGIALWPRRRQDRVVSEPAVSRQRREPPVE